jgi:hypothetical protein
MSEFPAQASGGLVSLTTGVSLTLFMVIETVAGFETVEFSTAVAVN